MTKKQSVFYTMCLALSHFYTKYETEIKANAVLSRLFDEFFSHFQLMESAVQVQKGHTSEAAKQKLKEEDEMLEAVCRNAAKGYVYAIEKGLPGMEEICTTSSWKLSKLSDVKLHSACLNVYTALAEIEPEAIAEYGIEAADLTNLKKEIDDFYALISAPRADIITRSQATAKIIEEMKQLQELLSKKLDKIVGALPDTLQMLKNEYKAARIIIDRSASSDDDNDEPQQPES